MSLPPLPNIEELVTKALDGGELTISEGEKMFGATNEEIDQILAAADQLKRRVHGKHSSFVVTRNINFTNVCNIGCNFCNFGRRLNSPGAELLSFDEVADRAEEAYERGASEVCIQGGLHPNISGDHYRNILIAIKKRVPTIHVHAFSPFEIWFGSRKSRMSVRDFLQDLKDHGLDSMPGTAAEILDTAVRRRLTKNKLSAEEWVSIITEAHELGIPTTSTIMYGHIDAPIIGLHISRFCAIFRSEREGLRSLYPWALSTPIHPCFSIVTMFVRARRKSRAC